MTHSQPTSPEAYSVPYVIEKTARGERTYDLYSRLLEDRIIFMGTGVNDDVANVIVAQLLFLAKQNKQQDIQMYINSPGGSVTAGLAIYDTMQLVECDVATTCIGQAASMGAVLLAGGTKGKRSILPNSRVMIHQVLGGAQGQTVDVGIQYKEMEHLNDTLMEILAKHSGKTAKAMKKACDRDNFMSAEASVEFGLVDKIIGR